MEKRLTDLEMKISYQENVIEDLNKVVIELRSKLEEVHMQCKSLSSHIETSDIKDASLETPPPHY